eukprot:scaffold124802_cov39-Phaeocystis_antarctica.AAC.1
MAASTAAVSAARCERAFRRHAATLSPSGMASAAALAPKLSGVMASSPCPTHSCSAVETIQGSS